MNLQMHLHQKIHMTVGRRIRTLPDNTSLWGTVYLASRRHAQRASIRVLEEINIKFETSV